MIELKGRRIINTPVPQPSGTKVIIYGDSISANAGASAPDKAYTAIYEGLTGLQVLSYSAYSRTVQEGLQTWNVTNSLENVIFSPTSDQAQYNPVIPYDSSVKYLMIRLGINDALQVRDAMVTPDFKDVYQRCIVKFIELGWPINRLKLIDIGSYLDFDPLVIQAREDYNFAIAELGTAYGIEVVKISAYDATQIVSFMYADYVHPNDTGHLKHGTYLASLVS